jgi:anti-anti-sigma factor
MREDRLVTTPLALNTNRGDDGTLVLSAAGELDLSNIDTFTQALTDAINGTDGADLAVTVDYSDLEYMDSSGINVLFTHSGPIRGLIINALLSAVVTCSGLTEMVAVEPPVPCEPPSEEQQ